jgi:DNA-binding IclR family transcriptional regulator
MSTVQSVQRAFAILDIVAGGASGITEIAGQAMLPKSTVARLLATLETLQAVERIDDGTEYRIGQRVVQMAGPLEAHAYLSTAVQPHLERLSDQLGEATGFAVPNGYSVRNVSQVESPNPVQVRDYSGLVVPAHIGSPGLAMMSQWPDAELEHYLTRPLDRYTPDTMVDPDRLRLRLKQVHEDGYAWVHEEFAEGISSVASCLLDADGHVLGTIHAHGPTYRFPEEGQEVVIGELVRDTARQIFSRPT